MRMVPREHGGTVMVAGALLAGWGWAGESGAALLAMFLAVLGLFLAREPATLLLRQGNKLARSVREEAVRLSAMAIALAGVGAGLALAWLPLGDLFFLGLLALALVGLVMAAGAARKDRTAWAEALGVATVTLAAPAGYLGALGRLDGGAAQIYAAALLFFLGAMLHLRTLLRDSKARRKGADVNPERSAWWSVAATAGGLAGAAAGLWPWTLGGAVAVGLLRPVVVRGPVRAKPQRVGIAESVLTLLFVLLVTFLPRR